MKRTVNVIGIRAVCILSLCKKMKTNHVLTQKKIVFYILLRKQGHRVKNSVDKKIYHCC